jgi:glycosyltransferase involved in cell wall biosynthesis
VGKEIKVLQIITKAEWAGAQRVVYEICKMAKQYNNINMEVATGENGILVDKLEKDLGIKVHVLKKLVHPINPFIDYKGYKEIKRLIKENNYDVVHCHSTKAGILGRLAANKMDVKKIIYTVHGYWPILQYEGIKRKMAIFLERYLAKKTTDLVLISKSDIELSKRMKIGNEKKYRLIYNKITVEKEKIKKGILRKELNLNNKVKIIGNVSRIDKQKNPFLFVDIANEYLRNNDETVFVWIGDGKLRQQALEYVNKLNLEDQVKFIGFRENGIDYMNDFDLLLLTSNWEGVSITILEALELNIPILSTDVGGIKEIIGESSVFNNLNNISERINEKINSSHKTLKCNFDNFTDYISLYTKD